MLVTGFEHCCSGRRSNKQSVKVKKYVSSKRGGVRDDDPEAIKGEFYGSLNWPLGLRVLIEFRGSSNTR